MNFHKKNQIRTKIFTTFLFILLIFSVFTVSATRGILSIAETHSQRQADIHYVLINISQIISDFSEMRAQVNANNDTFVRFSNSDIARSIESLRRYIQNHPQTGVISVSELNSLENNFNSYTNAFFAGNLTAELEATLVAAITNILITSQNSIHIMLFDTAENPFGGLVVYMIIFGIISVLIILGFWIYQSKLIAKPIEDAVEFSSAVLANDSAKIERFRQRNFKKSQNEIGVIHDNLTSFYDGLNEFAKANSVDFPQFLAPIASCINKISKAHEIEIREISAVFNKFAQGEILALGKNDFAQMAKPQQTFLKDVSEILKSLNNGKFDQRLSPENYQGEWKNISISFNKALNVLCMPILQSVTVFENISKGNLSSNRITADCPGDLTELKRAANSAIDLLSQIISEISKSTSSISRRQFNFYISSNFAGDFAPISDSLNDICKDFREALNTEHTKPSTMIRSKHLSTGRASRAKAAQRVSGAAKFDNTSSTLEQLRREFTRPDFGKY
ncbi:MAG: hypothetical protein FWD01_00195 [Defluviitaleaceae bacterium]|nr:hypothetical protein [Defluviitaleaceae bacterium]